ncbi:Oidioi.mRNA.OKI2018_I69.chr1.g1727.t1.cds [Oikopleura dioica]|uniref:Oidioi.mRNA.OKI2018_I69.chr1.g1727.t1.cds n=1 Tax=Oikopleura dioica TaxID=34765 RepID=A0ABN7SNT8_OIKDI|nr:Oidioi.mRNA.OKI2018_I69.chr1.g1727.t1.cds [Oikopleura dioica]
MSGQTSEPKVYTEDDFKEVAVSSSTEDFTELERAKLINICGVDKDGRPVIVVAACRFPNNNTKEHQQLLRFIKAKLDIYVENDYSVIYFHHGYHKANKPSFAWLKSAYQEFDRKYKKNIKRLIVVHPTSWMKMIWTMMKPFISAKFGRKLLYVNHLAELKEFIWLNQIPIPVEVQNFDESKLKSQGLETINDGTTIAPESQFSVELDVLIQKQGDLPIVPKEIIEFLLKDDNIKIEGIFRRSASNLAIRDSKTIYDQGKTVEFNEPILPSALLKLWFRSLPRSIIPSHCLREMENVVKASPENKIELIKETIISRIDESHVPLLKFLMNFLAKVAEEENSNKMGSPQLAIVFGPCLCWNNSPSGGIEDIGTINNLIKWLIDHHEKIFS